MTSAAVDLRIRGLRPAKPRVDPYTAHGTLVEGERRPDGTTERALTVFLAGAECPFSCSFCDLWRYTLDGPTPRGALTTQLRNVLGSLAAPMPDRIKLYNASNFFDPRAVPDEDVPDIAAMASEFVAVTVESHVNTIGARTLAFARQLRGRLEVAVGLETIHPLAAAQLNKRLDLPRFDAAARFLADNGIDLRVFVLLGAPHVPASESVDWTVRTVEHAVAHGAAVVSIIPVRGGNGEIERLSALGAFTAPTLGELEAALDRCLHLTNAVVTADTWDLAQLASCAHCRADRAARLERLNVSGRAEPHVSCTMCDAA